MQRQWVATLPAVVRRASASRRQARPAEYHFHTFRQPCAMNFTTSTSRSLRSAYGPWGDSRCNLRDARSHDRIQICDRFQ
jgi:hypothetical protein